MNRRSLLFSYFVAVMAALLFSGPSAHAEGIDGLDQFVKGAMERYGVPGAAVVVVHDDKVVFLKGFGVRRDGRPQPVDEETLFMMASVAKTFTAALVGTFVDEKKFGWDDHVIDHLPELVLYDSYATRMVTPRDLLAHRSGLPPFTGDLLETLGYDRREILRRIRYIKPQWSFREKAGYSNPGFLAAGMLAAREGGKSWDELVHERLLKPLGMNSSGTSHRDWEKSANFAAAHVVAADGSLEVVPWDDHDPMGPAGSITSNAKDMAQWLRMQLNDGEVDGVRVLSAEAVREMHKPAMVETPNFAELPPIDEHSGFSYGLGWGVYHFNRFEIIEKGGARAGMRSVAVLVPQKRLGVAVFANRNLTVLPEAVRGFVLEAYLGRAPYDLQARIQKKADEQIQKTFSAPPQPKGPRAKASLPLAQYAGEYENDLYGRMKIKHGDEGLSWEVGPAKYGAGLEHAGYDNFLLHFPKGRISLPVSVTFVIDEQGRPTEMITDSFGTFRRVESEAK
jgi:CubicO group peptidase (beta-lactamase class C family)